MGIHLLLIIAAAAISLLGGMIASKGAVRTQAALRKAHEHDLLIDTMAWVDRKIFHATL